MALITIFLIFLLTMVVYLWFVIDCEEEKALRDLQKKIRDLEEENESLKKAMHYLGSPYHFRKIVRLDTFWTQLNQLPVR